VNSTYDAVYSVGGEFEPGWQTLAVFMLPGHPSREKLAVDLVGQAVRELNLPSARLKRLERTLTRVVGETLEQENRCGPNWFMIMRVLVSVAQTTGADHVGYTGFKELNLVPRMPDRNAHSSRIWGFFLIEKPCRIRTADREAYYVVEVFLYQE
jgi:hypothetical protein